MHANDISRYEHPHVFHHSGEQTEKKTMRVVLLTVTMMIVEIVAGLRKGPIGASVTG